MGTTLHTAAHAHPRPHSAMRETERMWKRVGETLRAQREALGYQSPSGLSEAHGGRPNWRVVRDLEHGRVRTLKVLEFYCGVLGLDLAAVLAGAVPHAAMSTDAGRVARAYDGAAENVQRAVRAMLGV